MKISVSLLTLMASVSFLLHTPTLVAATTANTDMSLPAGVAPNSDGKELKPTLSNNQLKGREEVIKSCEDAYANTQNSRPKIDPTLKKPGFFASSKIKEAYDRQYYGLIAFNNQMRELAVYLNQKITLRGITDEKVLAEKMREYSSNCRRFAGELAAFGRWVQTGEILNSRGMDESLKKTYTAWVTTAKKEARK